jgi:hypothetical protein
LNFEKAHPAHHTLAPFSSLFRISDFPSLNFQSQSNENYLSEFGAIQFSGRPTDENEPASDYDAPWDQLVLH